MFSRRRSLDRRRQYSREFLESFVGDLREAGFDEVTVVLPHNYASVDPRNPEEDVDSFIARDRNFAAVILKAKNEALNETMKVLFINSNSRAIFADDTFPMAESEPSGLFFQSPDPARAYAVFQYFYEYLLQPAKSRFVALTFLGLVSVLVLLLELMSLVARGGGVIQIGRGTNFAFDAMLMGISAYVFFVFSSAPTGLWVKPKRELKIIYLVNMALKGELRDNPIVQLAMTVIGGLIVAFFAKLLGWI